MEVSYKYKMRCFKPLRFKKIKNKDLRENME